MKKVKLNSKLSLNKGTITKLNEDQMAKLAGGICNWSIKLSCSGSGTNATNSPGHIDCCL